jgi:acetyl esterase/lipase
MSLDQETRAFIEKASSSPGPAPGEMPLRDFRAAVEPFRELSFEREEVGRVDDLTVPLEGGGGVPVRLYRPDVSRPMPALVWVHGGSWVRVTVDLMDNHLRAVANRSGCAVAAVDYGLSPESRFPRAIEEVYGAALWLKREALPLGLDPERIGIAGESSGGNIAAAAVLLDRRRRLAGFAFQALIIPVLDVHFDTDSWRELGSDYLLTKSQLEWAVEQYAPGVDRDVPLLSPLRADAEELAGQPPTRIVTAEYDPLKDEGAAYAERLRAAGVETELVVIHHSMMAPKLLKKGRGLIVDTAEAIGAALRDDGRG